MSRVRGTLDATPYRSSIMTNTGVFYLGVHKATLAEAGVGAGAEVAITLAIDDAPRPTDVVPPDLRKAFAKR